MFGPMKNELRGHHFNDDDEVRKAVHSWLRAQPKESYSEGIQKLVKCWDKCIAVKGEYVEK